MWRLIICRLKTTGPKFSQFHAVFRKIWQNHMLPPPEGWRPLLRGILDPPLKMAKVIGWCSHLWVADTHLGNPGSDSRYHHLVRGVKCLTRREGNLPVYSVVSTLSKSSMISSKSTGGGYGRVFRLSTPKPKFSMISSNFVWGSAVADPDFPEGGREPSRGGVNTPNFPENCMKSKEFGRPGGGVRPSRPP